jgi:hypothetical protein
VVATPPPVVVTPTREVRTASPVNEIAVDGGRALTLVGETRGWEYVLVWSPQGIVVRASLSCDLEESNAVLAGSRFAHDCYQGSNYVVMGTIRPLRARVVLSAGGSAVVSLAGQGSLVAGSVGGRATVIWRLDGKTKRKLRTYRSRAVLAAVDRGRLLVDRPTSLDVLSANGSVVATLRRAHAGGAVLRNGRVATISGRRLVISRIDGGSTVTRTVAPTAHLEDLDGGLVLYSVDTKLHLFRVADGRDVVLRLRRQFGYVHARLWRGSLFYAYNEQSSKPGHAGYVDAAGVRALLQK